MAERSSGTTTRGTVVFLMGGCRSTASAWPLAAFDACSLDAYIRDDMNAPAARYVSIVAVVAAALGLIFAAYSTYDYAEQLDRQLHAVHCSFIPGASASSDGNNPCKTALFSAYSALFRASWWGGVPISLFAVGAFAFFLGFALYLALARDRAATRAHAFLAATTLAPLAASIAMFSISLIHLHVLCKLCVGIYVSSLVLALAAIWLWRSREGDRRAAAVAQASGGWLWPPLWLIALGVSTVLPAVVYVHALPDYRPFLDKCGKLAVTTDLHKSLLKIPTSQPKRAVTLFEDPLCPTCKAFHERLLDEGVFEKLDVTLVMFPLDSECNWMVDRALHPGACVLAKAVLCGRAEKARAILEWSYDRQEDLAEAGKRGADALLAKISDRWGTDLTACVNSKSTTAQLNQHLHFAANNHIPVSTPQMFLGDRRICDEDTDLGMKYTLAQLAPEVLP
jgi:uncharacterized membrane protein/protein-disulfide isomerase